MVNNNPKDKPKAHISLLLLAIIPMTPLIVHYGPIMFEMQDKPIEKPSRLECVAQQSSQVIRCNDGRVYKIVYQGDTAY